MKRKYIHAIFFIAIIIAFFGTATAAETSPTTVNDQVTTSSLQDNPTVDTSTTSSTQNTLQDTPSSSNSQTAADDQATTSSDEDNSIVDKRPRIIHYKTPSSSNSQTAVDDNDEATQTALNASINNIIASNEDPVVITFDDGFESTYTIAFPIMEQYGIKGTVYVVPEWVGGPGYLTLAQLTILHNAGWTIASHSWSHPALQTLTTQEITTELQSTINWLNQNGFADGAYHLAYPYGQYSNNVLQVASQLGIKTARIVDWGTITSDGYTHPYGDPLNYLELPIILMRSDTPTNDWQSELNYSISQSGTAIFLFHDIVTGNTQILEDVTVTTFRTVIEYIHQTGVRTLTISQWYNERENIDSLSIGITTDKINYNPGENVVYNLDIFNNGAYAATNVVVRDTLPAGLTFVSATNNGIYSNGVITWNLANLAVNSHFTPSFTATVNQGTIGQNIQNTASVNSAQIPTPVTSQITIHINNPNTAAEIIINFDDGLESVYTVAFPIMQQYGIKGTVYVVTDWIGESGYLTQAQLTALHNAGWTIANHTYRHWWLPELTNTQITTEFQTAITYLTNNGFADGAYHLAYPYGEYDSRALQIASTLGIKTARTIDSGTINPNGNVNYLELPSNGFTRTTTTAQWKAWVDQAITTQTTSIILLHSIVNNPSITEDVSVTTFTAFIQYLAQTGVKTLTINQWYNEMNNPAPVAAFTATPLTGSAPLSVQFTDQSTGSSLSYAWDFNNDGTVDSTQKNPSYTYSTAGTYTVKLTVTNTAGSNSLTKTNYITVNIPAPVAAFTATPTTGNSPLAVQFTSQSTGSITGYAWDFNNDAVVDSTSQNPSYTYNTPGTYTVKLTVTGPGGSNSNTKTNYITVNSIPVANFIATPLTGNAPLNVQFTDQSTGSGTLTYQWDFNNDAVVDSTSQNPSYTYNTPGTYAVKLTVTGPGGSNTLTKANYITVNYAAPVANFIATPLTGAQPLNVQFTSQSTGSITGYAWDFNNDAVVDSTSQNPSYTYNTAGTYTVKLTVTGPGGSNSNTKTNYITVNSAPVANFIATPLTGNAPLNVQFTDQSTGSITSYAWDFNNDGVVDSTSQNPSNTYNTAGTYTVKLTVTGPGGSNSNTKTNYITVTNAAPIAAFTAAPVTGSAPLSVQFTDQSTGSITSYAWDFNNDAVVDSTSQNPSYTYNTAGTYTVKLTVTGPGGSNSNTKTNYITVNSAPVANFIATPLTGNAPLAVQFNSQSTGSITSYAWDFNNDAVVDSTSQNPSYTYNTPGTYTVKLTVTGPGGSNSNTKTNYITVTNAAPVAAFTAAPVTGSAPLSVQFTDQSTGSITSYQWDFNNDGTVDSTQKNPSYSYSTSGTYTVKLTVTGPGGSNSNTKTNYITVTNAANAGEIVLNFDDGYESVYTVAFPIMQQYGIKGTVYVVTDWIGDSGYLTQAQLTALHNAGWTIANHSYRHWWLPELTTTQITTEIQTAITYLTNNGFADGAYHFAYPYGEYDSRVLQIASTLGIKTARTIDSGTINPNGNVNYLELPSNGFTRTTTTAQWKAWVDQAITTQTTSIILLHSIVSNPRITEDVSVTTFTAFIQYLAQTRVKTLTINQLYNEIYNPAPVAAFTATPLTGSAPLSVQFTDQSTGNPTSYAWDFNNDGIVDSTQKNPSYIYNTPGTYTVKLTVTGSEGSKSLTRTNYITVTSPRPDLAIANFQTPTTAKVRTTYPITVTVTNNGPGDAGSFLVYLMENNRRVGSLTVTSLKAGQSIDVVINWIPSTRGSRSLQARVDPTNLITESNENNNLSPIKQVTVT